MKELLRCEIQLLAKEWQRELYFLRTTVKLRLWQREKVRDSAHASTSSCDQAVVVVGGPPKLRHIGGI